MTARSRDSGMTIIELLVAMLCMGIVFTPIVSATLLTYKTLASSDQTFTLSHQRQSLEVYFGRDVASAIPPIATNTTGTCYTGGSSALVLNWTGNRAATGQWDDSYEVDYAVVIQNGLRTLVRYACDNGVFQQQVTVADNLSPTVAPSVDTSGSPAVTLTVTDSANAAFSVAGQERAQ
jgi:type II secretory pathway pseudopilin PulG